MTTLTTAGSRTLTTPSQVNTPAANPSALTSLRSLIPSRVCEPDETLRIAEAQATRLVQMLGDSDNLTVTTLVGLPRLQVVYDTLPVSGTSHWNGTTWVICLNHSDSPERQRFTLLHEFKHIIDHGHTTRLYRDVRSGRRILTAHQQAERAADYFAGCALIPKQALKAAWGNGIQRTDTLAQHFGVSRQAMDVRLDQTGLSREVDPDPDSNTDQANNRRERCARPVTTPTWQAQRFRTMTPTFRYPQRSYS